MRSFLLGRVAAIVTVAALTSVISASDQRGGAISKNASPSPLGNEIAFEADFDGPLNIWISTTSGGNLRKLTRGLVADEEPAWSPSGNVIAFASTGSTTTDIWTIRTDGSGLRQLTSMALNNRQPAWSPNGAQIAFVSDRGGTNDIWIMNADGTSQQRLTSLPSEEDHPSFSPDGSRIVFSETTQGSSVLRVINAGGSGLRTLTSQGFSDWNPQWTSNGDIIFSSNRDVTRTLEDMAHHADGTGLTKVSNVIALDPVQLPNGHIIFADETSRTGATATITDFDAVSETKKALMVGPPTDKDQCKDAGWRSFTVPKQFKNQGDCIQFVNTGK